MSLVSGDHFLFLLHFLLRLLYYTTYMNIRTQIALVHSQKGSTGLHQERVSRIRRLHVESKIQSRGKQSREYTSLPMDYMLTCALSSVHMHMYMYLFMILLEPDFRWKSCDETKTIIELLRSLIAGNNSLFIPRSRMQNRRNNHSQSGNKHSNFVSHITRPYYVPIVPLCATQQSSFCCDSRFFNFIHRKKPFTQMSAVCLSPHVCSSFDHVLRLELT